MGPGAKAIEPEGLTPISEIDLRSLSRTEDENDSYLSLYLSGIDRGARISVDARLRAIRRALPKELEEPFVKTLQAVEPILGAPLRKGERGRIIFASAPLDFRRVYHVGLELETLVVWDRSPFLLPLARLKKDYQDYGLLLIDSQEARLFLIRSRAIVEKTRASIDLMNKHKKGGWSQMRFNRLRRGAIKAFLTQVVGDLQALDQEDIKGLVLAGPGEAKVQLLELLPDSWRERILGSLDVPIHTAWADLARMGDELSQGEQSRENALAEKLKENILRGGPAAYGPSEVRAALLAGRVNYLLLLDRFALPQMICKKCHFHGQGETCPDCGSQMQALRLEELYEQAERTGAEVVLVQDDAFLESVGGMGAILRY